MVWARKKQERHFVRLTDGYVQLPARSQQRALKEGQTPEVRMAEHLYELSSFPGDLAGVEIPRRRHVWVVGSPGWLEREVPESLAGIVEAERQDDYRIIVTGADASNISSIYLTDWRDWLKRAGMYRKRRHDNYERFQATAAPLLTRLVESYLGTRETPAQVLEQLGIDCVLFGDD